MKFNVNVVVVTYNRLELLKLTLEKLIAQTYTINKIIIVDNASTDGTEEFLLTLKENSKYHIISMKKNEGGAGGFYHGIKAAYKDECDFVWIMDDDCICTETALENLINAYRMISRNRERKIGFLSSDVRYKDGNPCLMNIPTTASIYNEFVKDGIVQVTHTSFVAMLIPSKVIKEVGLPYKEFFIWGDDGEYSTRILQNYLGYLVGQSVVYHYMNENKGVNIFDTPPERISRFYYFYRNWMFTDYSRNKKQGRRTFINNIRLIFIIARSKTQNRKEKMKVIWKGTIDGLKFKAHIDYVE